MNLSTSQLKRAGRKINECCRSVFHHCKVWFWSSIVSFCAHSLSGLCSDNVHLRSIAGVCVHLHLRTAQTRHQQTAEAQHRPRGHAETHRRLTRRTPETRCGAAEPDPSNTTAGRAFHSSVLMMMKMMMKEGDGGFMGKNVFYLYKIIYTIADCETLLHVTNTDAKTTY